RVVADHRRQDPGEEVQVAGALAVDHPAALAVDELDRLVVVEGDPGRQHLAVAGEQLGVGHDPSGGTSRMCWWEDSPMTPVSGPLGGALIAPGRARAQPAASRGALADLVEVVVLPPDDELPDACFVDDCAVVLGGQALLTRPGPPARGAGRGAR